MDIIPRIFEYVKSRHYKNRPNALGSSPFRLLPPELLLLIASYLPPESAGILALCCTPLYSWLCMDYVKPLKERKHLATYNFLVLVAQDLPTFIACPHCSKLHYIPYYKYHRVYKVYYRTKKPWLKCRAADIYSFLSQKIQPRFSSTLFRMAMKTHREGQDTTKILQLLSYRYTNIYNYGFVMHHIAEARVQSGSLIVREQRIFMIPSSQTIPVPRTDDIHICCHHPDLTLQDMLKLGIRIPHSDDVERYENTQGILCCEYCYTEFRIDFKSYRNRNAGNAMFVTRWMDLGEGYDTNDIKWRNRLKLIEELLWRKVVYERGTICAAFEQAPEFRFDSLLTEQDLKRLNKRSYWPWPKDDQIQPCDDIRPLYEVVNGRFVRLTGVGNTELRLDSVDS